MLEGRRSTTLLAHQDKALVDRMLRGEPEAFDECFRDYFPRLYRFALVRLAHDSQAAEDVVQATFVRGMDRLESYRGEASLFTWFCTICRHEVAEWRRSRPERNADALIEDGPAIRAAFEALSADVLRPDEIVRRKEIARLVRVVLDTLPPRHAAVLECKYLRDLSVRETAEHLQIGPKAVESLLARAREGFREAVTDLCGDGDVRQWLADDGRY